MRKKKCTTEACTARIEPMKPVELMKDQAPPIKKRKIGTLNQLASGIGQIAAEAGKDGGFVAGVNNPPGEVMAKQVKKAASDADTAARARAKRLLDKGR